MPIPDPENYKIVEPEDPSTEPLVYTLAEIWVDMIVFLEQVQEGQQLCDLSSVFAQIHAVLTPYLDPAIGKQDLFAVLLTLWVNNMAQEPIPAALDVKMTIRGLLEDEAAKDDADDDEIPAGMGFEFDEPTWNLSTPLNMSHIDSLFRYYGPAMVVVNS